LLYSLEVLDAQLIARAVELSRKSMYQGLGGPFGAVVARDGEIVAEGSNLVISATDPTAHAEIVVIREAARLQGDFDLSGCTIYTSCEPCPMCLGAILWARIDRIVYANTRSEAADVGFDDELFYREMATPVDQRSVRCDHLPSEEAREVLAGWGRKADRVRY
jgi:tRNA(Arg) A34 adenosine deaminase TadA